MCLGQRAPPRLTASCRRWESYLVRIDRAQFLAVHLGLPHTWFRSWLPRPTVAAGAPQTSFALNLSNATSGSLFAETYADTLSRSLLDSEKLAALLETVPELETSFNEDNKAVSLEAG